MTSSSHPEVAPEEWSEIDRTTWAGEAPGPDPIGEAAHAVWDALDLASMAAGRDPDAPHTLDTADQPVNTEPGVWGILAVWGTTPVRITVEHARPEEAAALGMDGNARDLLCVALDDGTYQQPVPEPEAAGWNHSGEAASCLNCGGGPDGQEHQEWCGSPDADTGHLAFKDPNPQIEELRQQLVIEDGEDAETVARSLIGPKGRAVLASVSQAPGDMYPTAVYRGTRRELATVAAKANGSPIGRPPGGAR